MAWFKKTRKPMASAAEKSRVPEGLMAKCPGCAKVIYNKDLAENLNVCPNCAHHFRLGAVERLRSLFDNEKWTEHFSNLSSNDPLKFKDTKSYSERLRENIDRTGLKDSMIVATGQLAGINVVVCAMEYDFIGGSMGVVGGEKTTRAVELSLKNRQPLIIVSCSGGARMMEGALSLMQMAKISAALARLDRAKLPFISVLTDPTTGGVTASFGMLGDVILAEPGALIGFAGPRVIKQTIGENLPEGFQTSEFLLEKGFVDHIVSRREMKTKLSSLIDLLSK